MADKTGIEWTDATWNPIVGCSIVSPGCINCYAMRTARGRIQHQPKYEGLTKVTKAGAVWTGDVRFWEPALLEPVKWKSPRRIFVNSMGDLFHEDVPDEWIDRVFAAMALAPQHQFQVLTKRADRMRAYMTADLKGPWAGRVTRVGDDGVARPETDAPWRIRTVVTDMLKNCPPDALNRAVDFMDRRDGGEGDGFFRRWPLPNVWLGVSAERQQEADARIPLLLATPASVRFLSAEPLLGPIDLRDYLEGHEEHGVDWSAPTGGKVGACVGWRPPLDWIIVGGESGKGARPMHPNWARSLRDQCEAAGVPFLFKQWGAWVPHKVQPGEDLGGDVRRGHVQIVHPSGRNAVEVSIATGGRSTEPGSRYMALVGKKIAGRTLDGRTHDAFPAVST